MEIMLTIILILQVVILFHLQYDRIVGILRRKFPDKTANAQKVNAKNPVKYRNLANKPLLKVVVEDIGGKVEEEKEDGRLVVEYHGEHFLMDAPQDSNFVVMFDTWWHDIDLTNLEQFSVMREAINTVNTSSHSASIMYSVDEGEGRVGVHCKSVFPFNSQIPALKSYLQYYFSDVLTLHQTYYRATEEIRQRQTESKEKV